MKRLFIFVLILTIAITTRLYLLGEAPNGFYLDEAAQGYNAFSLLKTGKDEFGMPTPILFRSFADFKTPIYTYLIVPLIYIFGLSAFTVRLPSFLFSIATFPILYLLIQHIAPTRYKKWLPMIVSLLLAISPWHILFARADFECNVALFFMTAGIYTFYLALKRPKLLLISASLFAIAITAYHSQRIVTPLLMIALFVRHRKILLPQTHKKYLLTGAILELVLLIPTLKVATTPGFLARAGLNIFSWQKQRPAGYIENGPALLNSPLLISTSEFLSLYTAYFSPRNIFLLGDYGVRTAYPMLATFFVWQFPFYILGIYLLIKKKDLVELRFLTLALLFISPLPAAVTRDPYTTIRALQMVVPLTVVLSLGIFEIWQKTKFKKILLGIFLVTIIYSLAKLYSSAIILNDHYRAREWNFGWQQAAEVLEQTDQSLPVIVDNSRDEPYIQLAFFLQYDPAKYQQENFEVTNNEYYTNLNRVREKYLGRITTRPIDWEKDLKIEQYLIGDELAISLQQINEHKLELIEEIDYPEGSVAIRIVKTPHLPVKR